MGVREITMTDRQKNEEEMLGVILTDNSAEVLERNEAKIEDECDPWEDMLRPWAEKEGWYTSLGADLTYLDYEVCGIVVSVSPKVSKNTGKSFGIVTIEYGADTVEFTVFANNWKKFKWLLKARTVGIFTLRHRPAGDYPEGYIFQRGYALR